MIACTAGTFAQIMPAGIKQLWLFELSNCLQGTCTGGYQAFVQIRKHSTQYYITGQAKKAALIAPGRAG